MITFFAEIELSAGNEEESVSSFLQENGKELIVADRPSTERIPTDLGKFIMEIKNVITFFAEIELAGNEEESDSSFLQENGKEYIVADRPSTDLGKMHYGDKNVITLFAEIELSARNEEEPVSGHSVVVYADEERNSSEIGKIHLSLAYFDVLS